MHPGPASLPSTDSPPLAGAEKGAGVLVKGSVRPRGLGWGVGQEGRHSTQPENLLGVWGLPPPKMGGACDVMVCVTREGSAPSLPCQSLELMSQHLSQLLGMRPTVAGLCPGVCWAACTQLATVDHPPPPRVQTLNKCTARILQSVP